MVKQQAIFLKIIGISAERALNQYNIPTIGTYIDQQCLKITERILKDPKNSITKALKKSLSIKHH